MARARTLGRGVFTRRGDKRRRYIRPFFSPINAYRSDPNTVVPRAARAMSARRTTWGVHTYAHARLYDVRPAYQTQQTIHKRRAKKHWSEKENVGVSEKDGEKKEAKWREKREEERKIESSSEADRDRDGALERVAGVSEKNAKMHASARGGEGAGGGFDEDRASERAARGWLYAAAEREAARKRNSDARRAEDVPIRTETGDERGGTSARGDRESTGTGRTWASEREGNGGMKKREGTRGKRGGTISRGSERERPRARVKAGGREREGARRRGRRRERDGRICVLKQTFDQSADCCQSYVAAAYPSVPVAGPRIQFRVFTRRGNQGPSAARGYPRKPRAKCVASRGRRPCGVSPT